MAVKGAKTRDDRRQIGSRIRDLIQNALNQRGSDLPSAWAEGEQMYRGDPVPEHMPLPGVSGGDIPYNIVAPRVDQLTAAVAGTITSNNPYMMAYLYGQDAKKEDVEETLQFFYQLSDFTTLLENALPKVAICGLCPVMVEWGDLGTDKAWKNNPKSQPEKEEPDVLLLFDTPMQEGSVESENTRPGFKFRAIHPNDFAMFPTKALTIQQARFVGHRFWLRQQEVEERQKGKVWFKDPIAGGDNSSQYDVSGRNQQTGEDQDNAFEPKDTLVELWDCVVRMDLNKDGIEEGYRCVVSFTSGTLLHIEPYKYSRPHYFDLRFHRELESFWNIASKVRLVKPIQLRVNELVNILHNGLIFSMIPPIFGDFGAPSGSLRYNAGELVQVDPTGNQPFQLQTRFNPSIGPQMLATYERQADALFRMSQAALGQQFNSRTTAAEVGSVMAGQQLGIDHDIAGIGLVMREMYEFSQEVLLDKWDEWYPVYSEAVQIRDRESLETTIRWELNGKSPMMTPMGTIQRLMTFVNLAFDPRILQALAQKQQDPETYNQVGFPDPMEVLKTAINQLQFSNAERLLPSLQRDEGKDGTPEASALDTAISAAGTIGGPQDGGEGVGAPDFAMPSFAADFGGGVGEGAGGLRGLEQALV